MHDRAYMQAIMPAHSDSLSKRVEPLRWPCPSVNHPGVSTLYLDHRSWYEAAEAIDPANKGKRFLTPSAKVEIFTPDIEHKLAAAGHGALPIFYTHPEVTGQNASIEYADELVTNPVNPQALTPKVKLGRLSAATSTTSPGSKHTNASPAKSGRHNHAGNYTPRA